MEGITITLNVQIPALDRLCNLLMAREYHRLVEQADAGAKEEVRTPTGPHPSAAAPLPPSPEGKAKEDVQTPTGPHPSAAAPLPPSPEGKARDEVPPAQAEPTADAPVALDAIQRAAAELRDAGKLQAVAALFPEYHIRKLSDLKPEQTGAFAAALKGLGATRL